MLHVNCQLGVSAFLPLLHFYFDKIIIGFLTWFFNLETTPTALRNHQGCLILCFRHFIVFVFFLIVFPMIDENILLR